MATVEQIEAKLTALLANINPQQRRNLAKNIGMRLRKSQSERIAKLRTARFLKVRSNSDEVVVGFEGNSAHIANIHQRGLTAKVKGNIKIKYAQRELLGFTDKDLEMIEELVVEQLAID